MSWIPPEVYEKGKDLEIEDTTQKYMHKVKKGIILAQKWSGIEVKYNLTLMRLGVFKGLGRGWVIHKLILKK